MTAAPPDPKRPAAGLHPLVWGAAAAAVLAALGSLAEGPRPEEAPVAVAPAPLGSDGLPVLCGPGTIPDGPVCVPLPEAAWSGTKLGRPREPGSEDAIPRRPERPANYGAYLFPLRAAGQRTEVTRVGLSDEATGLLMSGEPGQEAFLVDLENQEGQATAAFVTELDLGVSGPGKALALATKHAVREAGQLRSYLVVYGNLARLAGGVVSGARLTRGQALGTLDDGEGAKLYLDVRLLREGAEVDGLTAEQLLDATRSIPCDVRNVLPLTAP